MSLDSVKPALIPCNLLAVWSCLRFTVRSAFDLTFEYVCHPCISDWFWLMVPQLLLVTACNLWDNKLDILGYQLTLLPGHWLTGISPSPHLRPIYKFIAFLLAPMGVLRLAPHRLSEKIKKSPLEGLPQMFFQLKSYFFVS